MERKLSSATSKLRNLKDFLSSTRTLNQSPHHPHHHHYPHYKSQNGGLSHNPDSGSGINNIDVMSPMTSSNNSNNKKGSKSSKKKKKAMSGISMSLFDLVEPSSSNSNSSSNCPPGRPQSLNHLHGRKIDQLQLPLPPPPPSKAVSMYGLADPSSWDSSHSPQALTPIMMSSSTGTSPSRNPAIRLFYNIRSKFRRRRKGRSESSGGGGMNSQNDDPMLPVPRPRHLSPGLSMGSIDDNFPSRFPLSPHLLSSQSANQLDRLNFFEECPDTFAKPLGSRDDESEEDSTTTRAYEFQFTRTRSLIGNHDNYVIQEDNNEVQGFEGPGPVVLLPPPDPNHHYDELSPTTMMCSSMSPSPEKSVSSPQRSNHCRSRGGRSSGNGPPIQLRGLTSELCDLLQHGWYWGGLSKVEAEEKLKGEEDGAFIVRDSSSDHYLLSLSFNSNGKTLHARIEYRNGLFCFYSSESECFPSVAELVDYFIANPDLEVFCYKSRGANRTSYRVCLKKPISRFTEFKSLKYLSRFVIRQYVRLDLIQDLPLPPSLIDFISEQRYI